MSQAIKIAVVGQMVGDAALPGLLTKHPADPTKPAILNGTKSQFPPVYDCLTYRLTEATPDKRFRPALVQIAVPGAYSQGIEDFYLDCEGWTQTPDSAPLDAINARLDALFHEKAFPTTAGPVFYCERIMRQTDLYHDKLNAWYSLNRYQLRFQATS